MALHTSFVLFLPFFTFVLISGFGFLFGRQFSCRLAIVNLALA